ncbi:hypothetical protein JVU11DRAFT_526 [Chiua virens]|nr:hypothetical protein JVU11DRAFT_526 [Chiua virens]
MDGPTKELEKLRASTEGSSKGKIPSVESSLDSLLHSLREVKSRIEAGTVTQDTFALLSQTVDARKKEIDEKQKEIYNAIARLGKALDKKFTLPLPTYDPLFTTSAAKDALDHTIALHLLRTGQFSTAETFIKESGAEITSELRGQFVELHRIITALRRQDVGPALEWSRKNRTFLRSRSSPLEFYLHRSQYVRLLLSSNPTNPIPAISRNWSTPHTLILPSPSLHTDLEPLFAKEYCASLGMSRQVPLRVVGDIGGGGALARIEKARNVMKERKSEWSQSDELPVGRNPASILFRLPIVFSLKIEIPVPPENRYHSIFACPVSKDQSTEQNPPMMMTCGHVITKTVYRSLAK